MDKPTTQETYEAYQRRTKAEHEKRDAEAALEDVERRNRFWSHLHTLFWKADSERLRQVSLSPEQRKTEEDEAREKSEAETFGVRFHRLLLKAVKQPTMRRDFVAACAFEAAGLSLAEEEPDDECPPQFATREEAAKAMADLSGLNSVVRGEPKESLKSAGGLPTKDGISFMPPEMKLRPHVGGCTKDKDHPGACWVPVPKDIAARDRDRARDTQAAKMGAPEKPADPSAANSAEERRVRAEVAAKLSAILDPSGRTGFGEPGLEDALREVARRLSDKPGPVASAIRDAALEDAAIAATDMLASTAPHLDIPDAIRALKSKTAKCSGLAGACRYAEKHDGLCHPTMDWPKPATAETQEVLSSGGGFSHVSGKTTQQGLAPCGIHMGNEKSTAHCTREAGHDGEHRHYQPDGRYLTEQPNPVHDFGWALARMREGKKVRRQCWVRGQYWALALGSTVLAREDVFATDWQVVE